MSRIPVIALAILFLTCAAATAEETPTVKIYPLKWAHAEEMLESISTLIGENGKAFKYSAGNELIVSTTADLHTQVSSLIKDLDHPSPNVLIDITINETGKTYDSGFEVKGSGKVVSKNKGSKTHFEFSPEVRNQTTIENSNMMQSLLIQSGREGSLYIGEEIPYADWLFYYGKSHGYINPNFQFETKRTGGILVASVQVIGTGPLISITLTPEIRTLVGKTYRRFRYTGVSTTVTASDGQPFALGSSSENREFYDKFLTGFSRNGRIQSLNITLTPHIKFPDNTVNISQ